MASQHQHFHLRVTLGPPSSQARYAPGHSSRKKLLLSNFDSPLLKYIFPNIESEYEQSEMNNYI